MPLPLDERLETYVEEHSTPPAEHLRRLAEDTRAQLESPQMLTGTVEGRLLELLVWTARAKRVLEIGTYSGYSALAMAAALPDDGELITCEISERHAKFALERFAAAPEGRKIDLRVGPALDTIAGLSGPFDLVFIDADKKGYRDYYEATLPLLSEHGLMALDNTLWSGRVADPDADDGNTVVMRELNDHVGADPRVVCVMLTVRDGITLVRRAAAA